MCCHARGASELVDCPVPSYLGSKLGTPRRNGGRPPDEDLISTNKRLNLEAYETYRLHVYM